MKIIRAEVLGFCTGVRRAVDIAYAHSASGKKVYTLGPLIHHPQVLEDLMRRGIQILGDENLPDDARGVSVIIRAHGVSPQAEDRLRRSGAEIIDATCPKVKSSQLKARALAKAGYRLFLAGEECHAEIIGIMGYACPPVFAVVGNAQEARKAAAALYEEAPNAKTAIIGQTTISAGEYQAICAEIVRFFPALEIAQTPCSATQERQDSLRRIMDTVDAVIIAGGKDSANTRRLLSIAEAAGKPCALVETPTDTPPDFYRYETIGIASGTSTPDKVIDEIAAIYSS